MNPFQRLSIFLLLTILVSGCALPLPLASRTAPGAMQQITQSAAESSFWSAGEEGAALALQLQAFTAGSKNLPAPENLAAMSATPARGAACPFVSFDEAVAIVMEVIPPVMDGDADFCGYGGLVEIVLGDGDPLALGSTYGVAVGTLTDEAALSFFRRMATALNRDTRRANEDIYEDVMKILEDGDMTYAIHGLLEILLAIDDWIVFDDSDGGIFPGIVFIKPEADGGPFIMFIGRDAEERTLLVFAHVGEDSYPPLVMEGLAGLAERLTGESSWLISDPAERLTAACSFLTEERAEAMLGGPVENYMTTADECGYFIAGDSMSEDEFSSVGLVFSRGDEALDILDEIATDIEDQRPRPSRLIRRQINQLLEEGDLRGAFALLPDFAARQRTIQLTVQPDVGDDVIAVVWQMDEITLRGLVAIHPNDDLILLLANLYQREDQDEIDAALVDLMQEILAEGGAPVVGSITQSAPLPAESAQPAVVSPEERLARCYDLQPADAEAILGEGVTPEATIDSNYGYCVYASVAANRVSRQEDLLPTAGPLGSHQYLAVTVWPVGSATDPLMYLAYAILDREHSRLNRFLGEFSGRAALVELADVESQLPNLSRAFLPELGDGALWYWQESTSGDHLAGVYAISGAQRIVVQALVNPTRNEEDVLTALIHLTDRLMQDAQITR
ncbi:MAG: hypothetical protein KF893_20510 [Caldilineaceae bacterium]|nr:hypothetical protein [Caldilineaceae bacterium]